MKELLLVEDDKQLVGMYSKKFHCCNFNVTVAHDGSEAIQLAKTKNFDVIVLDLMLPGLSGLEVLEILRQDKRTVKVPIIVYTNYGDPFNKAKCLTYGADEFLLKVEATPESLCKTVNKVLKEDEKV